MVRAVVALAIFGVAAFVLYRELSSLSMADFKAALRDTESWRIGCAMFLTTLSFAGVAAYDVYAARIVAPDRIALRRALFAGILGNGIANTLGFHAATGAAVRYRIYASAGLSMADVARIIGLQGASVVVGFAAITALALLIGPDTHGGIERLIGLALAAALGGLLFWLYKGKRGLAWGRLTLPFPSAKSAGQQMTIGVFEMAAAIGAIYILFPAELAPNYFDLVLIYMSALLLGVASGAPGGVGVFEATFLVTFADIDRPEILAALLLYRLVFNLLPFAFSVIALLIFERHEGKRI